MRTIDLTMPFRKSAVSERRPCPIGILLLLSSDLRFKVLYGCHAPLMNHPPYIHGTVTASHLFDCPIPFRYPRSMGQISFLPISTASTRAKRIPLHWKPFAGTCQSAMEDIPWMEQNLWFVSLRVMSPPLTTLRQRHISLDTKPATGHFEYPWNHPWSARKKIRNIFRKAIYCYE